MKIALLFPGYGSQFVGMGKELYDTYRIVQEYFEEASSCLNVNAVKLCFASSDIELSRIENAYPAIFLISTSIAALLQEEGIVADIVGGYSQGEYAALCAAGGINLPDGLYFLRKLAGFYQALLEQHQFASVRIAGIPTEQIEDICLKTNFWEEGKAFIAVYSSEREHIVSGNYDAIERLREMTGQMQGVTIDHAEVQMGLHSPLMDPVVNQIKIYREKMDFKDLTIPLVESVNGTEILKKDAVREQLLKNTNSPIVWTRVLKKLELYDVVIEVGPGTLLAKRTRELYPEKEVVSINKKEDIDQLKQLIAAKTEKENVRQPDQEATEKPYDTESE